MKVDKAVCTTNDTLDDLQRAIRYEAVFNTLVEKKILAIKADCEAKEREKREQTCFAGRFFRKKRLASSGGGSSSAGGDDEQVVASNADRDPMKVAHGTVAAATTSIEPDAPSAISVSDKSDSVVLQFNCNRDKENASSASDATTTVFAMNSQTVAVNVELHCHDNGDGDADNNEANKYHQPATSSCVVVDVHGEGVDEDDNEMKEVTTPLTEQYTSSDSTCADASQVTICDRNVTIDAAADGAVGGIAKGNNDHVEPGGSGGRIGDAIKPDCHPLKSNLAVGGGSQRPKRTGNHVKMADGSPASICSRLEVSIISEDACRRKVSSDTTSSYPSSCKQTILSAPEMMTTSMGDSERHRLRVLEAKSISAQCSPIFPRHVAVDSVATQVSYRNEAIGGGAGSSSTASVGVISGARTKARKLFSRQNTSEDSVNVTFSNFAMNDEVNETIAMTEYGKKTSMFAGKRSSKKDKTAGETLGFISNFNQLTAHNNLPVLATQLRGAKLQRYLTTDGADCVPRQKSPEERFHSRDSIRDKSQRSTAGQNSDEEDAKRGKKKSSKSEHFTKLICNKHLPFKIRTRSSVLGTSARLSSGQWITALHT